MSTMRTAVIALSIAQVGLLVLPANAMCVATETYTVKGEIVACEEATAQLREAAGRVHEREGKVAYPDREQFIALVLSTNLPAVLLTVRVLEERSKRWEWGRRGRMRKVEEFESTATPRVEQFWYSAEQSRSCEKLPIGTPVQFAIDTACDDMIPSTWGPAVTGHRIALDMPPERPTKASTK